MARQARYRWQNERKRGLLKGQQRKRGKPRAVNANAKPITDKQRSYIRTLQSRTGTREPMPRTSWQASQLIKHLIRTDDRQRQDAGSTTRAGPQAA